MPEWSWRWGGGGVGCGLIRFSTCSLLHFCPSQQPIHLLRPQFPSLSTITVFPFSALTFSHFQVMTLIAPTWTWLIISPSIPLQVKIISSAFLQPLHMTLWLRHGRVTRMPLFLPLPLRLSCRLLFLHLLIKNNNLCHACLLPPTVCDLYVCRCAFVVFLSLHQPLLTISRFPPPSLSPISSAAQSGSSMLKDLKAIISEKKSQQGFLSYQIWLVSFEHILSSNPSLPWRSHGFLFVWPKQVCSSNKHDFWII